MRGMINRHSFNSRAARSPTCKKHRGVTSQSVFERLVQNAHKGGSTAAAGCSGLESTQHARRRERNFAQANSDGIKDRISNRRRNRNNRRLAASKGRHLRPANQYDLDIRYVTVSDDRVARPVEALNPRRVEQNFLEQRSTHSLDDVSLNLILQPIGIDNEATVMCQGDALD